MPYYESIFIARQDVSAPQVEALTATFADILRAHGGQVTKTEQWGLRNLAYRIKKNKKGHYVLFNLDAPHEAVAEMERNMGLHEDILRFMTVRVDELEAGPSAMMRRDERDAGSERGDRGGRSGFRPRRENTSSEEGASA
ncbi:MAG: 30S ribosomal protein S6 [Alphaproteobacteria bacterium]|nr:30S ribosomal protein S6 [Alphaproteobacteria bacterium]